MICQQSTCNTLHWAFILSVLFKWMRKLSFVASPLFYFRSKNINFTHCSAHMRVNANIKLASRKWHDITAIFKIGFALKIGSDFKNENDKLQMGHFGLPKFVESRMHCVAPKTYVPVVPTWRTHAIIQSQYLSNAVDVGWQQPNEQFPTFWLNSLLTLYSD